MKGRTIPRDRKDDEKSIKTRKVKKTVKKRDRENHKERGQ